MCQTPDGQTKPSVELADIFRMHGKTYKQKHTLTPEQHKVFNAILNCRTNVLGGHVKQCDTCSQIQCAYNSCRNRHCPKCESFKAAKWLESKKAELLPVRYFHVVFTLPHKLNNLILYNKRRLYNLLFESAWETLNKLGKDPKRLNGQMGALAVLHTWGQNLTQHNHVHCIVPGGAIKPNGQWQPSKDYLFPVKVLSKLFRGIFVSKLKEYYQQNQLRLPDKLTEDLLGRDMDLLLNQLMRKDWVVYAKPPFTTPEAVLNYLGRYTHKIAISNYRILSYDENTVTFKWRDYADNNQEKIMTLNPEEFIRRFLSHVVPNGFMRIRSFGFLSNASKAKKLPEIQAQLNHKPVKLESKDAATLMFELTGKDINLCPSCQQGRLRVVSEMPSQLYKFKRTVIDSS